MRGQRAAYCFVLLLFKITNLHGLAAQIRSIPERWILGDFPVLSLVFAQSKYLPDGPCKEDTRIFLRDLRNGTNWAAQMFDSSSKHPEGILSGYTRYLGNFDECYNLQVDVLKKGNAHEINGKYCLVDIEYRRRNATLISHKLPVYNVDRHNSFWEVMQNDFFHVRRDRLQLAICVPSSCEAKDVETALRIPLEVFGASNNIELRTAVQPVFCQTAKEAPRFTLGAGIYCAVLFAILCLTVIGTWYDYASSENVNSTSGIRNFVLMFSASRNYKSIFHTSYTHTGLDYMYLVRFICCIALMNTHVSLQHFYNPTSNADYMEYLYTLPLSTLLYVNCTILVNMFFALSGTLVAMQTLKDLDRHGRFNFIKNIATRYMRLTPLYALIICFNIWILPLLGTGPFWKRVVTRECARCTANWWQNLLYISNYVEPEELCMLHSWSLAADFQLYLCSHLVIYAFWRMPRKIGYSFLGLLTLMSCALSFIVTYLYDASPVTRVTPYIFNITEGDTLSYHIKTYMSVTGYLVGIITGVILHDRKKGSAPRLSKFWSRILVFPLPLTLYIALQHWAQKFFTPHSERDPLEAAFHVSCQKFVYPFFVCSTIIALSIGSELKFYYNLFTPRWVQPLANLTYGAYLVHFIIVTYNMGQAKTVRHMGLLKIVWDTIPIAISSFVIALFLAICVEIPCRKIVKQIFYEDDRRAVANGRTLGENKKIE